MTATSAFYYRKVLYEVDVSKYVLGNEKEVLFPWNTLFTITKDEIMGKK